MTESGSTPGVEDVNGDASSPPELPRLVAALERVDRWHRTASSDLESQAGELRDEADGAEARIKELEATLLELRERQAEIEGRLEELQELTSGLETERAERLKSAVVEALAGDLAIVDARAALLEEAEAGRRASLERLLEDEEVAKLVEEFEQFVDVEPTLEQLPAGYRKAILSHHEAVKRRLQPLFEAIEEELEPVDAESAAVSILASIDYEDGQPLALVLILPVRHEVYREWAAEGDGLAGKLGVRVVGAVSAALSDLSVPDAAIRYTDIDGQLAVQIWLGDGEGPSGDVKQALHRRVHELRSQASELRAVRTTLHLAWVPPEIIEALDEGEES